MLKRHGHVFLLLLVLLDLLAIAAAWLFAYLLSDKVVRTSFPAAAHERFIQPLLLAMLLGPLVYHALGLYAPKRTVGLVREAFSVQHGVLLSWGLTYIIVSLARQTSVTRLLMVWDLVFWLILALFTRMLGRLCLRHLRSRGFNLRRAAIVGAGRLGQRLHATLASNSWSGIETSYFIDDGPSGRMLRNLEVKGPLESADALLRQWPVDIVFVALSRMNPDGLRHIIDRVSTIPVDLRVVPDLLAVQFLRNEVTLFDDLPVVSLTDSPQQGWNSFSKSIFDRISALLAIAVFSVPMLLIALMVKLTSPGPILYFQIRTGLGGRPFEMLKFRTMRVDAERSCGPIWTVPDDPRVTRFGRLLRRTSLDELPQLINVLRGEMSLVGPRPERPELIERIRDRIPRYMLRQHVKPGMTGWAQIHGMRGDTSLRKRIQYDLYYVKHWSFALDFWILLMTPSRGLMHANAY